ncbi:sigma-70 family RNA polymerase sigma factor [Occultella glacieicola]|uniref:Sigma-70 family RNA polymerase sigma factor n=1 Tax=Occultella glacieicola TaxID=2518684 RepID=A0ABY2E959_9MICO|nr:sigma-70 family RNA polymerase sigma factor [Occultella glacieicola]TDE99035.1 sigma-70 family RNA polymerase sigma factor [Occultella glacieicola]
MDDGDDLTALFERARPRLRAVAYRMLGSLAEADDALQDAWLRADRAGLDGVENPAGWLTTVVVRTCLNRLRARANRREDELDDVVHVPDPLLGPAAGPDPEQEAVLADSVGLALMVVLDTLPPAERLAFVLHDMFAVPFDEIAPMLQRSPTATRQLASRGRRRVAASVTEPDPDVRAQREVVEAFFAASRDGDLDALVAVLHPDVVLRSDGGRSRPQMSMTLHGPAAVSRQAFTAARLSPFVHPVLVNGVAGVVVAPHGRAQFVMAFTVRTGRILAIDVLADTDRLAELDLPPLGV